MRRILVSALVGATVAAGSVVVATPADAAPSITAGTYVPLPVQRRLVDTRTGAYGNHEGAVRGGHGITPQISGAIHLPSGSSRTIVPEDAVAVAATISAVSPTADGGIVGYVGTRPAATNLQFTKGHAVTDTAILQLSGHRVNLFNTAKSGTVQIVVDVSGYYGGGTASATDPGVFHSIRPYRAVDTVTGAGGNRTGALTAGHGMSPKLDGQPGVPADAAGAVAVTITAVNVKKAGTLIAYRPDEPKQSFALLHFVPGRHASAFAVLRVSGGRVDIVNTSGGTVDVVVDIAGYYNTGFATTTNAFQTLVPTRAQTTKIAADADRTVPLAGTGGIPVTGGVSAVLVTLHAVAPTHGGGLQAWEQDKERPSRTTVLQFGAGQTTSDVVLVPVVDGRFNVHNSSDGSVTVVVDIDGYVSSAAIDEAGAVQVARYVRNITDGGSADVATMYAEGMADAKHGGPAVALLDIGAQSNDKTGVVLSATDTKLTYAQLVKALDGYVAGFDAGVDCSCAGLVAIGTNNDGANWTDYPAAERGQDWWDKVVHAVTVPPGDHVRVAGANDIEAGFGTHRVSDAMAWKTAFLAADPVKAMFVFNGSADGCPQTWTKGATCAFGWTEQDLYDLASGPRTQVLPQIYFGFMATQWAEIDATGGGGLPFLGELSEYAVTTDSLSPQQANVAYSRALSSIDDRSRQYYRVDIQVDD